MPMAALGLVASALLGWADITVSPSKGGASLSAWQRSIGGLDRPSERTVEVLKRHDVERRFRHDPDGAIDILERAARKAPEPELVFALAELSWIEANRIEARRLFDRRRDATALDRYLDTVSHAWDYLFDDDLADGRQPSDPRYRLACDLYNGGLDRLIRATKTKDRIQPGDTIELEIHGRKQTIRVSLAHCPWSPGEVDELILADDLEVSGLDSRTRRYGLGVPLIGVRRAEAPGKGADRFYPPEVAFPLTAVMRPVSKLRETDAGGPRECTLDLVDPIERRSVLDSMPLEADVTTPLAYMWTRTDLSRYRWTGLLRPGEAAGRAGLMLLRPYEADKIPVVMVHGLVSSPLAWIPMLNELLRDPTIQQRYQFLLYVYPTGVPVPIAASGLRDALIEAQQAFDTGGKTAPHEFREMVLLGHSMGGLLSHSMAVHSGDELWKLSSHEPFDAILGPPAVLDELRKYTFFEALPFVRRVVFLATPHRGSELSRGPVGRLGSGLIAEPDHYTKLLNALVKKNPDAFDRQFRHLPTSIDTLESDSEVLLALLKMKPGDGVAFHSIIGAQKPGNVYHTSDGVVDYRSSHFEGAASERVVRSDHGVQRSPQAIQEVRRILLEHLSAP